MTANKEDLNGIQKAAAFLISMGPKYASDVMKYLTEREIAALTVEISQMSKVSSELKKDILKEFVVRSSELKEMAIGGADFAKEVLKEALGEEQSETLFSKLGTNVRQTAPFEILKHMNIAQLIAFIKKEQPQTIALILSYLDSEQGSVVLASLPPDIQANVIMRIATIDQTTPEIITQIESVLQKQMSSMSDQGLKDVGGVKAVAEMLNRVDRSTEKNILESLEKQNAELADEIKKLMFVFEDIILVEDRSMQQVLKEVDTKEIAVALKAASEEVKNKVFNNMSKRAAEMIQEEMEFMGPVRLKDVEESQQRIVAVVRRLEEEGAIIISGRGGGGDEIIV